MENCALIDEFSLISTYFRPLTLSNPAALGLMDDAALLVPSFGKQTVITCDALVGGVHFLDESPPRDVAARALRTNLSDLAAMGATPIAYTLALMVPTGTEGRWFKDFAAQLYEDQEKYGIFLIGGDTVVTPGPLSVSVTAFGEVPVNSALTRSGARVGDSIFVTGTLGDAYLGLRALKGELKEDRTVDVGVFVDKFCRPEPRLSLAKNLLGIATAAVDVSDGLLADIEQLCRASDVGAVVREMAVPLSEGAEFLARKNPGLRSELLNSGDDYELALVVPGGNREAFSEITKQYSIPITEIGFITGGNEVNLIDDSGTTVERERGGYRHFF
jgi:thiamine-monophosphate kinase